MAHRAARIAGPMLRARNDLGRKRVIATPAEVRAALEAAEIHPAVIREWENEAHRRVGVPGSEAQRGSDYRAIIEARRFDRLYSEDKRFLEGVDQGAAGYRPGLFRRLMARFSAKARRRARRKAQSRARRRSVR